MPPPVLAVAASGIASGRARALGAGCALLAAGPLLPLLAGMALLAAVAGGLSSSAARTAAAQACPAAAGGEGATPPVCPAGAPGGIPIACPGLVVARGFQVPIHAGIDLDCPAGSPVLATAAGTVRRGSDYGGSCAIGGLLHAGGYGTYAILEPAGGGALRMYYGHLESYDVPDGATVAAGAVIGREGSTGCSTGPHLHFEIRVHGLATNPCPHLPEGYPSPAWRAAGCPLQLP